MVGVLTKRCSWQAAHRALTRVIFTLSRYRTRGCKLVVFYFWKLDICTRILSEKIYITICHLYITSVSLKSLVLHFVQMLFGKAEFSMLNSDQTILLILSRTDSDMLTRWKSFWRHTAHKAALLSSWFRGPHFFLWGEWFLVNLGMIFWQYSTVATRH